MSAVFDENASYYNIPLVCSVKFYNIPNKKKDVISLLVLI